MKKQQRTNAIGEGFTLIELLVVIAIIAVLAGALLIAINPQSMIQKGRDSKRLQDVDTLVKAINLALADGEILLSDTAGCSDCNNVAGTEVLTGEGYVKFAIPTGKTGLSKFVPTLPVDPISGACTYNTGTTTPAATCQYTYGSDGTNFEVNTVLEHADNYAKMGTDGGNSTVLYETGTSLTIL